MLKIIISPAKKMNVLDEFTCPVTYPAFLGQALYLHGILSGMSQEELKELWRCSDKLVHANWERLHSYSPSRLLTPALLAYEGIQYQYMAPHIFSEAEWEYAVQHLRILSGFYGILRPTDGVVPYRLEMQAKLKTENASHLYDFWGGSLYDKLKEEAVASEYMDILNLASAEYSRAILPYIKPPVRCFTCIFGEEVRGKTKVKATQAKMARGEMVRWMAENQISNVEDIRDFRRLDYEYQPGLSTETEYVFIKNVKKQDL